MLRLKSEELENCDNTNYLVPSEGETTTTIYGSSIDIKCDKI